MKRAWWARTPVGSSWRVDDDLHSDRWKYLYRAVARLGQTVGFCVYVTDRFARGMVRQ
ncbi:MAG: hypothetical protein JF606_27630 [Burkholderiales bacterium]|nr:hypothetical protein [Burkholderiales bacterium]